MNRLRLTFFNFRVGRDSQSHPADPIMLQPGKLPVGLSQGDRSSRETVSFSLASSFRIKGVQVAGESEDCPKEEVSFLPQQLALLC